MRLGNLVAVFSPKRKIRFFLRTLYKELNVNIKNVYVYNIEGNDLEYLLTFKYLQGDTEVDLKSFFSSATTVHVKNGCIFSINALNKLIEQECDFNKSNLNYHAFKIDWEKYRDKLILLNHGDLQVHNILKVSDNTMFFKK